MTREQLTDYEKRIAQLITNGYTARAIASYLGVSVGSVDWTVESIKKKLNCRKNTQIAYKLNTLDKQ